MISFRSALRQFSHYVPGVRSLAGDGACAGFVKAQVHVRDLDDVYALARAAVRVATEGKPGPVHISVPVEVLKAHILI